MSVTPFVPMADGTWGPSGYKQEKQKTLDRFLLEQGLTAQDVYHAACSEKLSLMPRVSPVTASIVCKPVPLSVGH